MGSSTGPDHGRSRPCGLRSEVGCGPASMRASAPVAESIASGRGDGVRQRRLSLDGMMPCSEARRGHGGVHLRCGTRSVGALCVNRGRRRDPVRRCADRDVDAAARTRGRRATSRCALGKLSCATAIDLRRLRRMTRRSSGRSGRARRAAGRVHRGARRARGRGGALEAAARGAVVLDVADRRRDDRRATSRSRPRSAARSRPYIEDGDSPEVPRRSQRRHAQVGGRVRGGSVRRTRSTGDAEDREVGSGTRRTS